MLLANMAFGQFLFNNETSYFTKLFKNNQVLKYNGEVNVPSYFLPPSTVCILHQCCIFVMLQLVVLVTQLHGLITLLKWWNSYQYKNMFIYWNIWDTHDLHPTTMKYLISSMLFTWQNCMGWLSVCTGGRWRMLT